MIAILHPFQQHQIISLKAVLNAEVLSLHVNKLRSNCTCTWPHTDVDTIKEKVVLSLLYISASCLLTPLIGFVHAAKHPGSSDNVLGWQKTG